MRHGGYQGRHPRPQNEFRPRPRREYINYPTVLITKMKIETTKEDLAVFLSIHGVSFVKVKIKEADGKHNTLKGFINFNS